MTKHYEKSFFDYICPTETPTPTTYYVPDSTIKEPNPKDALAVSKVPLSLWPTTATLVGSLALLDGGCKYGRANFRVTEVKASVYIDACLRHLFAYAEGEEVAEDSGVPHLGHALACLGILVDAKAAGTLVDDRAPQGGYLTLLKELGPLVESIRERHKDKKPKHYTR
jgi:hypothetical protein